MRRFALAFLAVASLLCAPLAARAEGEKAKPPPAHTDEQVAPALAAYEKGFADADLDVRIKALRTLSKWRHKDVLRELKRVLTLEEDLDLKAAAAEGFAYQTSHAAQAGRAIADALKSWEKWATNEKPKDKAEEDRNKDEQDVLVALWGSVGPLGWKDPWKDWKDYIDHANDAVAAAAITAFGKLREYRALPLLLDWFNIYPDGVTWAGGSVSVDTGAEGGADQAAAEAKWRARFGNRPKSPRPAAVAALLKALKEITGKEFKKPAELKDWMEENKLLLRKHGA
jgi:hypothetical protein